MMLSKKNSETLENFSEKLEVEGRSLWQDARRRFMHNRAAVASLIVLVLIALFVILAPMLSQFAYDDTDWAMMSSAPDMESYAADHFTPRIKTCSVTRALLYGARMCRHYYRFDGHRNHLWFTGDWAIVR